MISAKILADSVNVCGDRLTSYLLKYPRFIHAEFMTHRALSRNAASSRAVPVMTMLKGVWTEPVYPHHWGKNCKGMAAAEELSGWRLLAAKALWRVSLNFQLGVGHLMAWLGAHKQLANRLLEPYSHITVLATATEWGNFFNLRCQKDAQPEMRQLARAMLKAYAESEPELLSPGQWHVPFGWLAEDPSDESARLKVAVARAARLSYLTFDGEFDNSKDFELHDRLIREGHFSPTEHQARALSESRAFGNFRGFLQYRKTLPFENRREFDAESLLGASE